MSSESQASNFALCGKVPKHDGTRRGWLGAIRKELPGTHLRGNPNIQSKLNVWKKDYKSLKAILSQRGGGFNLKGNHMIHCDNMQWEKIVKNVLPGIAGKDKTNGSNAEEVKETVNKLYAQENVLPEICDKYKTNGSNVEDIEEAFNILYAKEDVLPEICGKDKTKGSNAEDVEEAVSKPYAEENVLPENFGKDKANGSNAEDIQEAVNKLYAQENVGKISAGADNNKTQENMFASDATGDNVCQGEKTTQTARQAAEDSVFHGLKTTQTALQTGRKRKAVDGMDGPLDMLKKLHQDKNAILEKLATRIGYEFDLSKVRKGIYHLWYRSEGAKLSR
ncbi:hypothetical protein SASPL_141937 [Salvia splendens]|uniref:Myb/SANT-like domain-containing protein n=1 Tax=Salvia splendens TaxID=180675 RepID=A0A8X8WKG5_SALSN|nr:hypothetical protein SASPL_141937 [Salvia splendens]